MSGLYITVSVILVLTALVHTIIGEIMIFRKLSNGRIVPHQSAPPLKERNIRILWASWHLTSIFGLVLAAIIFRIGNGDTLDVSWLANAVALACSGGALLVLIGTKGRHPGWISLSLAALLIWFALYNP